MTTMKIMMKSKCLVPLLVVVIILLVSLLSLTTQGVAFWNKLAEVLDVQAPHSEANSYDLSVHYLDVGKADAVLIQVKDRAFMIDSAKFSSFDNIMLYLEKRGIEKLDALFLTHPDNDHIGSAHKLIEEVPIETLYMNNKEGESSEYYLLIETLDSIDERIIIEDTVLNYGEAIFEIYVPEGENLSSNNSSLVIRLCYEDIELLFMGDTEEDIEKFYIDSKKDLSADVLMVAHHGSKTGTTEGFLEYVSPSIAVISTGYQTNTLPDTQVLDNLLKQNIEIYRTDTDGTIMLCANNEDDIVVFTE